LFLASVRGIPAAEITPALHFATALVFVTGMVMIVIATWEFFADRRRIVAESSRQSWLLITLVVMTLVAVVMVAGLLLISSLA